MNVSPSVFPRWVSAACLLLGTMDSSTGLSLLISPETTLGLMGIHHVPEHEIFIRFIGAFVLGVGLSYFTPFRWRTRSITMRSDAGLAALLAATAVVRVSVAIFVGASVAVGALEFMWVTVAVTDGSVALGQVALLRSFYGSTND